MADLDTLRPEVRDTLDWIEAEYPEASTIRAELLRLAVENATARGALETLDVEGHKRAEKAEAELAALRHENAQLRDVLADRDMDREMAAHANRELAALKARIAGAPVYEIPLSKPKSEDGWARVIESVKNERSVRGKRVRLVVEE